MANSAGSECPDCSQKFVVPDAEGWHATTRVKCNHESADHPSQTVCSETTRVTPNRGKTEVRDQSRCAVGGLGQFGRLAFEPGRSLRGAEPVLSPHGCCALGSEHDVCRPLCRTRRTNRSHDDAGDSVVPSHCIDWPQVTGWPRLRPSGQGQPRIVKSTRGEDPEGRDALQSDNT